MSAKRLSYGDVLAIVAEKPIQELVLVGGQALNAWAEAFKVADAFSEGLFGAALSGDIDFLGMAPAAISFAQALGADVKDVQVAGFDDNTPNTAVVVLDYAGERKVIDFLGSLKGFSTAELEDVRKWAAIPEIPQGSNSKLKVMHPIHCLQSQLENVYGILNRRAGEDGERNATRVRLAAEVTRCAALRYLEEGDTGSARKCIEHAYELAGREPALRARAVDRTSITENLPVDERLGADFREKRLLQLKKYLDLKTRKYDALTQRRARLARARKLRSKKAR